MEGGGRRGLAASRSSLTSATQSLRLARSRISCIHPDLAMEEKPAAIFGSKRAKPLKAPHSCGAAM